MHVNNAYQSVIPDRLILRVFWMALLLVGCLVTHTAWALDAKEKVALSVGENETRIAALNDVLKKADITALPYLQNLLDDAVKMSGEQLFIVNDDATVDALTGAPVTVPEEAEDVVNSTEMRTELEAGIAALNLLSKDAATRLDAAKSLQGSDPNDSRLALIQQVEKTESQTNIRETLRLVRAGIELASLDKAKRLAAAETLADTADASIKQTLLARLEAGGETDKEVVAAIKQSVKEIDSNLTFYERAGQVFTGVSLGSILLLAALGLAVTYGLMGIINMAHGEMMMIGAYATFIVQNLFIKFFPDAFQWYLIAAIPVAFVVTALVGILLERSVLRFLYGRPLETLLATWGVSLILMQAVRSLFGAQNVQVENPAWMSGGIELASNLVLPYNRIFIIVFAILVLLLLWLLITKTRLGLFIRAVTQNRAMASCTGVNTAKVDAMAFGLGSGIAGLAGVALSQIGNVGPALGQSYIVDSFMVVVLGGVGQLAGAVYAAMGLGILSKFLEGMAGAVLAKIFILVVVIIFIQKRPQGLFAFKGRQVD